MVWVNMGGPAYDLDGSFVGKVVELYEDEGTAVVLNANKKQKFVDVHQLVEIVDFPIDEKNLLSDWITDEFLDNGIFCSDEYVGFLFDNPIYCWVERGKLHIKNVTHGPSEYDFIIERIIDIFDCCTDNTVVTYREFAPDNHLVVTFYSFIN